MSRNYHKLVILLLITAVRAQSLEQIQTIDIPVVFQQHMEQYKQNPLLEILDQTIVLELKRLGFKVLPDKGPALNNGYYRITSNYVIKEDLLEIKLECFQPGNMNPFFSTSIKSRINLEIGSAVKKITAEAASRITQDTIDNPANLVRIVPETKKEDVNTEDSIPLKHYTLSANISPFLSTGRISDYFKYGNSYDLFFGYNYFLKQNYIGIGIFLSYIYFTADGVLLSSNNKLLSAGPETRINFKLNSFLETFLRINGGLTLFMMNRNNEGYKSTLIPFALGGMGLSFAILPAADMVLSMNFYTIFEESILITGFYPSAGVSIRM